MKETWLSDLRSEIESAETRAFAWGDHDCCLFAARCVDAMTGSTMETAWRAEYHDESSAMALLETEGGLQAAVTNRLGSPIRWTHAQRGDLCLMPSPDGMGSLGVCVGAQVVCVAIDRGIHYLPMTSAIACWSIR
jgi:hypothetical protein